MYQRRAFASRANRRVSSSVSWPDQDTARTAAFARFSPSNSAATPTLSARVYRLRRRRRRARAAAPPRDAYARRPGTRRARPPVHLAHPRLGRFPGVDVHLRGRPGRARGGGRAGPARGARFPRRVRARPRRDPVAPRPSWRPTRRSSTSCTSATSPTTPRRACDRSGAATYVGLTEPGTGCEACPEEGHITTGSTISRSWA